MSNEEPQYDYELHGAGEMGVTIGYELAKNCGARTVTVFDPDPNQCHKMHLRLRSLVGKRADIFSYNPTTRKHSHVVISAAPHTANVGIAQNAMDRGVPYCDLGGSHDVACVQKTRAYGKKTPVVVGCGWAPGTAMVVAADLAAQGYKVIEIFCGGLPYPEPDEKQNPAKYKCTWSRRGLAHELSGKALVVRGGILKEVRALSTVMPLELKRGCCASELFEAVWTSNNSFHGIEYLRNLGVEFFDYRTLRYRGHTAFLENSVPRKNGLLDEDRLFTLFQSMPEVMFDREVDCDRAITLIRAAWAIREPWAYEFRLSEVYKDTITNFTAMEIQTALGATIVAHALATGTCAPKGFATPEMCVDRPWYIAELKRRLGLYNMHH